MAICFIEMVGVTYFLCTRFKHLDEEKNKRRCGYIYEDLNYRVRGRWALTYPVLYQLRFGLLVIALLFLNNFLVFQVLIVSLSTIFIMTVIGFARPFAVQSRNKTELASEMVILITCDMLLCASDPKIDPEARMILGWAIIGILGVQIITSQGSLIFMSVKAICRRRTLKKIRKRNIHKHKKLAKKRQIRRELKQASAELDSGMRPKGMRENQVGELDVIEEEDYESDFAESVRQPQDEGQARRRRIQVPREDRYSDVS